MQEQQSLEFQLTTPAVRQESVDPMKERREKMEQAFAAADARFKEEYQALLMRFVEAGKDFTGEDVQAAYRERAHLPQPREWRSVGGMYQKLVRRGVIVAVGYAKRSQGNPTPVYRRAGA